MCGPESVYPFPGGMLIIWIRCLDSNLQTRNIFYWSALGVGIPTTLFGVVYFPGEEVACRFAVFFVEGV